MRIQHVEVIGFGPFKERTSVTFPKEGLSLVLGPNESGKSLLMKATFGIIFGLTPAEVERYRGWYDPSEFEGKIRLSVDDVDIEVVRYFDTQVAEIWDVTTPNRRCIFAGEVIPDSKDTTYYIELAKLVGFQDAEIATGTTFVTDRELETHVSDKLRQMIGGSKRADYEKILNTLKAEFAELTRQDPWTGQEADDDGKIEKLEKEIERLHEARQQVHQALRTSHKLRTEISSLQEQYQQMEIQVEEEQRALEGLSVLEGLMREEAGLLERINDIHTQQDTVRALQEQLSSSLDRVASEHAPLLPLQTTFQDDMQGLVDSRRELSRLHQKAAADEEHRKGLQTQLKKRTEDLQAMYGAFEDLAEDFPEKLLLYSSRQRELTAVRTELSAVEKRLQELDRDIEENYPQFCHQEADFDDRLRALEAKEEQWRREINELEADKIRRRSLEQEIHQTKIRLQDEFLPYQSVAEDFPTRVRTWQALWEEMGTRQAQVERARHRVEELQAQVEREHPGFISAPPHYEEALKAWRKIHQRFESEMPRLEREYETVKRLHQEQDEAEALIRQRYANLVDRVELGFPERLREHKRLREELLSKTRLLEEAKERLKMAEDLILSRFGRFLEVPWGWGERLEQHRKNADQAQVTLEKLEKDLESYEEVRRELEVLNSRTTEDGEIFDGVSDSFPELLREYVRLKPEVDAKEAQIKELKETIHTLEGMALREYSEFFGVGDDFAERLVQYRTDRSNQDRIERESEEAREAVNQLDHKLRAIEVKLGNDYSQFQNVPETVETTVAIILRDLAQRQKMEEELSAVELQHWEKAVDQDKAARGIIGRIRRNTTKLTEDNTQKSRVDQYRKQIADIEKAVQSAREQLGPLREREDFEQLQVELGGHRRLLTERTQLTTQLDAARVTARKAQGAVDELSERLRHQKDLLDVAGDSELESKLPKYKEYRDHMARLNAARKILKSHQTVIKGEEQSGMTDLDKGRWRLGELAAGLGNFAARFTGPPAEYEDCASELIDGFRTLKRRKQEAQRLRARLSNMQSEKEISMARQETVETLSRERQKLGLKDEEDLTALTNDWHEFERLQARIEAEEGIIRSHEMEMVEENDVPVSRLQWLQRRVEVLQGEIGDLSSFPDTDQLVEDSQAYLDLRSRLGQIVEMLGHHTSRELLKEQQEALYEARHAGLAALGLPLDAWPDLDVLEPAWDAYKHLLRESDREQAAWQTLLETEDGKTVLERLSLRLDELAQGLGDFTQVTDLDDAIHSYEDFKALRKTLDGQIHMVGSIASEAELDESQFQLELIMEKERQQLGVVPGETLDIVRSQYKEYVQRTSDRHTQTEVRARLISTVSVGEEQGASAESALQALQGALDELRQGLGGFEDAGEESDEVISQFREAQQLKRDIAGLRASIKALRSPAELEAMLNKAKVPVLALENRLRVAGDLNDLDSIRTRFRIFEELQQAISSARRGLEEHPTLASLDGNLQELEDILAETGERVKVLLEDRAVLARYYEKFSSRLAELRPTMTHNLSRLKENLTVLNFAVEKLRNSYRQHTQPTSGARGNLAVLQEQVTRREADLERLRVQRNGLRLAIDRLESVVMETQEHLVGSLQIRAQDILRGLTAGRYSEVTLEGLHLEPVVKNKAGIALREEAITGGLRDQLFFALRAAMAQEMAGNVLLPFILDDPFRQFDDSRLNNARQYLQNLSERTQVILFTHDERCREWGQVLINLGQPEAQEGATSPQPTLLNPAADKPATSAAEQDSAQAEVEANHASVDV